jgi:hypothetical protein
MAENRPPTRLSIAQEPHRGIRLVKIWSPDLSATQIPPMCCRIYGEVCTYTYESLVEKLRARCAVASVQYLLGDIRGATELAKENWQIAEELERKMLAAGNQQRAGDHPAVEILY